MRALVQFAGASARRQRLNYPLDVILICVRWTCVRWYVIIRLSPHPEEMMAERGVSVDHSTLHRWAIKLLPVLEKAFRRRKNLPLLVAQEFERLARTMTSEKHSARKFLSEANWTVD